MARTELTKHDRSVIKSACKTGMSGGFRQVFLWAGEGFKEHWADSITLGIVTARDGIVDTAWVFEVKMAVRHELGLTDDNEVPVAAHVEK